MCCSPHLSALLKKNWILWKRNCFCSCCELLLPTLLIFALIGIRQIVVATTVDMTSYMVANVSQRIQGPVTLPPDMDFFSGAQIMSQQLMNQSKQNPNFSNQASAYGNQASAYGNQAFAQSSFQISTIMQNCINNTMDNNSFRNGQIALVPSNSITKKIETYIKLLNYTAMYFDSVDDMNSYIKNQNYNRDILHPGLCFGVSFQKYSIGQYQYSIHFNTSVNGRTGQIPFTALPRIDPVITQSILTSSKYLKSGFLTVQNWIDNLLIRESANDTTIKVIPQMTYVRVPAHIEDPFSTYLKGSFGVYLILPLMIIYLRMVYSLLYEKEKKLREGMKMMGLENSSFYLSWIITYFIIYTIISIIATILLSKIVFAHTSGIVIFLVYWLFCMNLIFEALFISVFFTRALFGLICAIVWYLIKYMVIVVISSGSLAPKSALWGASLSSHAAFSFACDVIAGFEQEGKGVTPQTLSIDINNYNVGMALIMYILNIIFYLFLSLYLDQVFPNEWGNKKHPLFFLQCFSSSKRNDSNKKIRDRAESKDFSDQYEDVDIALKDLEQKNEALVITDLYKTYPNGKSAVRNLNLSMYKNQIFALLGHNGAGKTTTLSMLTGLLDITSGGVNAFGLDTGYQIDQIRKFMGVCPQHDILFDNLTVKEHLEMFASFKGMKKGDIQAQVRRMIEDVDLLDKTDYLAKNLSGGQRRKLSVAIAFIGDSKLIYLDEPTSGMDTSARRYIWEMLKNYKEDKIVVLTTHFMDEADFLGDRIGIMGEGRLICVGSSVYLKNKFGVGYNLTIVKENTNVDSNPVLQLVMGEIPEVKILSNVSAEIAFQLPMETVNKFPGLFDKIDSQLKELGINSYGISITTLEEVFLKVAQIGAGHKQVDDHMLKENKDPNAENIDDFDMNKVRITSNSKLFYTHTLALVQKRLRVFKRDFRSLCCEILLPCVIVLAGLGLLSIQFINQAPSIILLPSIYNEGSSLKMLWAGNSNGTNIMSQFPTSQWNVFGYQSAGQSTLNQSDPNIITFQELDADQYYYNNSNLRRDIGWYYIQNVNDTLTNNTMPRDLSPYFQANNLGSSQNISANKYYNYIFVVNTVMQEAPTFLMNQMNQAILQSITNNPAAQIQVTIAPFVLTKNEEQGQNVADGIIGAFIFSIGMSFIPASIISYVVKEREINMKHQQLVSGVSVMAYWFSNFIVDVIKHFVPSIFCALMILAFQVTSMTEGNNYGGMWLLFLLYGWAIIPFCYAFSFLFKQQGNAMLLSFFLHLIMGAIVSIVIYILRLIPSTRSGAKTAAWFIRLFPSFCFSYGILNLTNKDNYAVIENYQPPKDTFDFEIAGGDIMYLALSGVIYMIIVFIIEALEDNGSIQKLGSKEDQIQYVPKVLDEDVQKEAEITQTQDPSTLAVLVQDVRKVYMLEGGKHKVAVDKVSFSVNNGDVFGLLGVNGAGKTTTFKILSGEIKPTSGQAYIAGYNIINQMAEARRNIGYCPQFDALLENLTVIEHLELYSEIKGIPTHMRDGLVEKKLQEMDLVRFKDFQTGELSGGNKRKLSVAIAMIGNPPIVFLDEPSTGMDPEARRFMWNVISRIATLRKQSSIILTTHSMEEAEALSTKIAIQVDGNLRCLGSVQHIKNKYGKGYEIEVKLLKPEKEQLLKSIVDIGISSGERVTFEQMQQLLQKMNQPHLIQQIALKGYGSHLYQDLQKTQGLLVNNLVEFVLIETMGAEVMKFIGNVLGQFEIIEHFQTFYRFRLNSAISVGKLFGAFELNKLELKISQYSIKQASIEQIFNNFAVQSLPPVNTAQVQIDVGKQKSPDLKIDSNPQQSPNMIMITTPLENLSKGIELQPLKNDF